ncbi:Zinc finger CCHC domain-containing protein 2 [Holothuria leucospilota]|uniref:Zinc finger CCHC domain-containing protein 2 n=1 Tax=Holothuria leucospilota TaxID=206669 RepID=A0A9Q1HAW7_HOLLE|nr:Zinc finger CCHC domain-containing protein 2 [Holothuria leucospilota]
MRERREFVSMVCKKEVIAWFSDLTTWRRIDFLCALMDCCGSAELRFLGTYIEALCRRDYDSLREAELSANDVSYLSKLTSASDKRILDKVLTSLALMNSRCTEGARVLFKMLQEHTDAILNGHDEPVLCDRENANCRETDEKVVLLAVMAVNHPAFTFSQKQAIRRQLSALLQAVESETALDVESEEGDLQPYVKAESKSSCDKNENVDKSQDDKTCIETIEMDSVQIRPSDKRYEYVFRVHWKDGVKSAVRKTHAELFEFQCKLVQRFPEVSNKERVIPYVPGETQGKHIFSGAQARDSSEKITSKDFLEYARKLSALPSSILNCDLMIEFFKENNEAQVAPSASPSTVSSNSLTSSTSKTLHSLPHRNKLNQNGDNQALPEAMSSTPISQEQQQQQPPHVHIASPLPHPVYPLTASLRHLDISHHHNINLTPPSPISINAHLNPSQHSSTSTPPASSASTSNASATSSGTNSVYFQTISSAVSIPTPAELYNVGDSSSDHVTAPRQPFDASLLSKGQASPQANSVSFAPPLPSTTEPLVSKLNATDGSNITPNENGDVPPVMVTPTVHLPHPMPCFTTSDCQPFSSTALTKSPVTAQIQEWLKKQRLHKYEHYFEGLSVEQILALTDEDIDKWDIVTGAKGRIKSQLEQLRQSLMNPANGMTTPTPMEQSQYAVTPPVTFIQPPAGPVPFQYYFIHPHSMSQGMVAPQFLPSAGHEGVMSSDNSSSGSVSRESSDECDRDSEESEPCGFQSQDVRTHCHVEPNRKHGACTPRHHQSKLSHANSKSAGNHTVPVSPVPYSQVVKNPVSPSGGGGGGKKDIHKGSRNSRSGTAPPTKRLPASSDGTPQVGQHPPLIIRGNNNSPVPHIAHSVMMSPRGQGKNETDLPSGVPSRQQKSSGSQKVNQSTIARSQMAAVPQIHGTSNQGWHPSNNGSQLMVGNHGMPGIPGNVVTSHIGTGQQIGSIQGVATSIQNLHMDQYSQNSQPRIEVPPHVPMVQVKHHGNRQSGSNHFIGEEGMGYRTVVMQSGVPVQVNNPTSESLQGHASPGMRSDGNYIGSASGPAPSNPKVIYSNPVNQLPGSCSAPSSHAPSENFSASSTTTYVQAANQNTVSVVASSLGMMQLAYSNQMVMTGSSGSCSCNPNNGNQSNQSCPLHHFPVTNALLPNPPYLPYQNFQNFFQGGVGSNHIIQPLHVLKGPTAPGNPRYMTAGPGPNTATIPSEILYGHQYGVMAQQGQMFFNQMSMGQRGPHSPHTGMIPDGNKKGILSCFNCGAQGHKASDCRETTMETITQNSQYRLNFKPDTTES